MYLCVLCVREWFQELIQIYPVLRNVVQQAKKECYVVPFRLSIGLKVKAGGGHVRCEESWADDREEFHDKLRAIVGREVVQNDVRKDPVGQ